MYVKCDLIDNMDKYGLANQSIATDRAAFIF